MSTVSAPAVGANSWAFHTYWQDRKQKPSQTKLQADIAARSSSSSKAGSSSKEGKELVSRAAQGFLKRSVLFCPKEFDPIPGCLTVSSSCITFEPDVRHALVREKGIGAFQIFIEFSDVVQCGSVSLPREDNPMEYLFYLQMHLSTFDGRVARRSAGNAGSVVGTPGTPGSSTNPSGGNLSRLGSGPSGNLRSSNDGDGQMVQTAAQTLQSAIMTRARPDDGSGALHNFCERSGSAPPCAHDHPPDNEETPYSVVFQVESRDSLYDLTMFCLDLKDIYSRQAMVQPRSRQVTLTTVPHGSIASLEELVNRGYPGPKPSKPPEESEKKKKSIFSIKKRQSEENASDKQRKPKKKESKGRDSKNPDRDRNGNQRDRNQQDGRDRDGPKREQSSSSRSRHTGDSAEFFSPDLHTPTSSMGAVSCYINAATAGYPGGTIPGYSDAASSSSTRNPVENTEKRKKSLMERMIGGTKSSSSSSGKAKDYFDVHNVGSSNSGVCNGYNSRQQKDETPPPSNNLFSSVWDSIVGNTSKEKNRNGAQRDQSSYSRYRDQIRNHSSSSSSSQIMLPQDQPHYLSTSEHYSSSKIVRSNSSNENSKESIVSSDSDGHTSGGRKPSDSAWNQQYIEYKGSHKTGCGNADTDTDSDPGMGIEFEPNRFSREVSLSKILSEDHFYQLTNSLPLSCRFEPWQLQFTPRSHGVSIQTFFRLLEGAGPSVLCIKDQFGGIFGVFLHEEWHFSSEFYGGGESFVFNFVAGELAVYNWTARNNHIAYSDGDLFSVGGGAAGAAFVFSTDFRTGTSRPNCQTFSSPVLSTQEDFLIDQLEVWTFGVESV